MRQALNTLYLGFLANPQRVQRVAGTAMAALFLLALPQISMAGGNDVNVTTCTAWLGTQFTAVFKTVRLIILGLAVLYSFWEGVKAFRGDSSAWMKMASGFLVAFIVYNPNWIMKTLFGTTVTSDFTDKGVQ